MKKEHIFDLDFTDIMDPKFDRRDFIRAAGGGIFIFMLLGHLPLEAQQESTARPQLPTDFNAFLRIGEDGRVSLFTGKIEMGQGVITSLAQMLADELDVELTTIDMVMGDTDLCPWDMGTFGSMSTRFFGPPLREAGAEGRHVLIQLAAEYLNVPAGELITVDGVVYNNHNKNQKVTYAQLAKGKAIGRHATGKVPVKTPDQFKVMGKSYNHQDAFVKVTGKAHYAGDIRLPGMLYAAVLRPPSHAANRTSLDLSEARKVNGAVVIHDNDLVAVLHELPDVAEETLTKIKATYDIPESDLNEKTIFDHLLRVAPAGEQIAKNGSQTVGTRLSATVVEKTYLDGYVAHAPIEPHTAVAHVEGDKATVWPSSQTPFRAKDEVAEALGLKAKNVRIISPFVGGGFGGKSRNLQVVEAARLSKLSGKPVMVAWTRGDEFFKDSFRPAAVVKIRSGIDKTGHLMLWNYDVYFAGQRGATHFYSIPNSLTVSRYPRWGEKSPHPFAVGAWRAPGNNTNTFARESHIDIMAAAAGIDPVEFRLQNLTDPKMTGVLKAAAKKFGWTPAKGPSGRGYGVALGIDAGTYVASMAEVEVDTKTGKIRVKRVLAAQDMGLAVNPEGSAIQMEGCITMGLGYALAEELHFKGGAVQDLNFDSYDIPRFSWLPEIETVIIDAKNDPPQGGGEPAIVTMGAVIANAVFDAVGARVLQMPLTPERVLEAMKEKG
ncbi:MAG: xanthine dehydrogenase family protein molybdopterin-binding subunit [Bacteroidales bacterium]|nr:xanthine dehydrogenase family protein molybdopterin-binding subunit [Bacteroidales bacterium]